MNSKNEQIKRKCSNCGNELIKIKNWKTLKIDTISMNEDHCFTMFASRKKNIFTKGTGEKVICAKQYVCTQCGKIETYLEKDDIAQLLEVEYNEEYADEENGKKRF